MIFPKTQSLADTPGATNYVDPSGYPSSWPSSWTPYTVDGNPLADQTNGGGDGTKGAAPSNETDVAPCGGESVLFSRDTNNIYFRMCLAGDPSGSSNSPFSSSANWSLLIDVDGDGYREFVITLDGKSSQNFDAQPDNLYVLYKNDERQDFSDSDLQTGNGNSATVGDAVLWVQDSAQGDPETSVDGESGWEVSETNNIQDFKRTRVVNRTDGTYYLDIQVPLAALDATNLGGTKITTDTTIAFAFATASSNTDPVQKDLAYPGNFIPQPDEKIPFGDVVLPDGTTQNEPSINSVIGATCGANSTISAEVIDSLKLENGSLVSSISQVEFFYYADLDNDGNADDGQTWVSIGNGSLATDTINPWSITWDTTSLFQGQYLLKAIATDDQTPANVVDSIETDSSNANYNSATNGTTPIIGTLDNTSCGVAITLDYGDAPDTYGTDDTANNSSNTSDPVGASHIITSSLFLGITPPDDETNGFVDGTDNNGDATDDDDPIGTGTGNGDDEDNFTLPPLTAGDTSYTIPAANITATNTTGQSATLHAWIDFDNSGTFESTEYASVSVAQGTDGGNPTANLTWSGINVGTAGDTYARFRLTTDSSITNSTPGEAASNGEVEDYQLAINNVPNPNYNQGCNTNTKIALVLDGSGSIDTGTGVTDVRNGVISFLNQIANNAPGTEVGIVEYASTAKTAISFTAVDSTSVTNTFTPYINNQYHEDSSIGDFTNWEAGLKQTNDDLSDANAVIFVTDGNPNRYLDDSGNVQSGSTTAENIEEAVPWADAIKQRGTHIYGFGINNGVSADNFKPITENSADFEVFSSADDNAATADYAFVQSFSEFGNELIFFVQSLCQTGGDPSVLLVKRITDVSPNPNNINFNTVIDDGIADSSDDDPNWQNNFLQGQINVTDIQPEDEVEYTIYFLSNGTGVANNVKICDVVPDHMSFVENGFDNNKGISLFFNGTTENLSNIANDDRGEFYSPNTAPPTFCQKIDPSTGNLVSVDSSNNNSGAVVVELDNPLPSATGSGTPSDSYGYIRFRVQVQ